MHLRLCSPRSGRWGSEGRDAEVRGFGSSGVQGFGARRSGLGQSPRPGRGCGQRPGAVGTLDRPIPAALPAPREGGKKGRREEKNKSEGAKPSRHREGREGGRREAARHGSAGKPEKLLQQRSVARPPAPPGGTEPARPVGWGPPRAPPAPRSAGAPRGDEGRGAAGRAPPPGKGGAAVPAPASIPMGAAAPNHGGWGPIGLLIRGASIRRATAGCPRCHLLASGKRLGWQPRSQPYTRRWVLFPRLRSVPWLGMGCGEPRRAMPYIHCGSICAFAIKMIITNIPKSRCAKSPLPNGVGFKPKQFS